MNRHVSVTLFLIFLLNLAKEELEKMKLSCNATDDKKLYHGLICIAVKDAFEVIKTFAYQ